MGQHTWETTWSGSFPNLCRGTWELYCDGELLDIAIPFNNGNERAECANTFGTYETWEFDDDYCEIFTSYESGLHCDEWCFEYGDWLSSFAEESEWEDIFMAFNVNDWRANSCGGCV